MQIHELFVYISELIGTAAFAVSGAMVAIDRKLDAFGVLFLGVITALGGGVIRDVLLGSLPPKFFTSYEFLGLAALCSLVVFVFRYIRNKKAQITPLTDIIFNIFDALGLGIFAIVGTRAAMDAGYDNNAFMCIFMGMTTGVGGGILRDILSRTMPFVLHKRIYALAAIIGSALYYSLERLSCPTALAVIVAVIITVTIRILAAALRWTLPRIDDDEKE